MRPKGVQSSSSTQNMQSSTGQYSTQAGEPAHPVQHSVITASSFGFFLRGVVRPLDLGSDFISSGTMPTAFVVPGTGDMAKIIARLPRFSCELSQNGTGSIKSNSNAPSTSPILL